MFLLNGKSTDNINLHDRGLHYGDGLFETIAVIDQRPLLLKKHLERLMSGCGRLKIDFDDVAILESEIDDLCKDQDRAVLKIIITSGAGGRGYQRTGAGTKPTRLLGITPWPEYPDTLLSQGINVHLCSTRLGHNPGLAGIKHLNRLEQVLARNEWKRTDITEGLMLDIDTNVIEGTMSNIFVIYADKKLRTPDLSFCGIEGIVRQYLLDHCKESSYECEVCQMSLDDLYTASEIFFCNSIAGIMPVRQLGEYKFSSQQATNEIKNILISQGIIAPP